MFSLGEEYKTDISRRVESLHTELQRWKAHHHIDGRKDAESLK